MNQVIIAVLVLAAGCKQDSERAPAAKAQQQAVKVDQAKMGAKKLAFEAYPQWAMKHPEKACPDKIDDLYEFADLKADPWGAPYRMLCGANLPHGAHGAAILSLGDDGKEGTADDIKSWE